MRRRYNSTGVDLDGGKYTIAPEGIYDLIIKKVTDTKDGQPWKTKNGDDYVSVECEVDSGDYMGAKVWHGVTFMDPSKKGAGMAVQFLKAIGEPWEGDFEIDTNNWEGRTFTAKLIVGKTNQGKDRNEIAYLITGEKVDDEVPF